MSTFKTLCFLLFSVALLSCNKDDESDSSGTDPEAAFNATINGGNFSNYISTLGFYDASSSDGTLSISVTDSNNNVVRLFMNSTGGLNSGVVKEINNTDPNNFVTQVVIRDQTAMVTYTSISGNITILENRQSAEDSNYRLVTGNFIITASTSTGTNITMTGNFDNIKYLQ